MENENLEVLRNLQNGGTLLYATYRSWSQRKDEEELRKAIIEASWYTPEGMPSKSSWHVSVEGIDVWPEWFIYLGSILNVGPTRDKFIGPRKFFPPAGAQRVPCASRGAQAQYPLERCPHCSARYLPDPETGMPIHADEGFGTTMPS